MLNKVTRALTVVLPLCLAPTEALAAPEGTGVAARDTRASSTDAAPGAATDATTDEASLTDSVHVSSHDDGEPVILGPLPSERNIADINRVWRGVGIGIDNGLWGESYAQGLKVDLPFGRRVGQFFGLRLRGVFVQPPNGTIGRFDPNINVGGEIFGRGPVLMGILRVYGGGGVYAGIRPNPTDVGRQVQATGGGHFGVEFLLSRRAAATVEIGGQGDGHALGHDAGASVMAGMMVYLGNLGTRR